MFDVDRDKGCGMWGIRCGRVFCRLGWGISLGKGFFIKINMAGDDHFARGKVKASVALILEGIT